MMRWCSLWATGRVLGVVIVLLLASAAVPGGATEAAWGDAASGLPVAPSGLARVYGVLDAHDTLDASPATDVGLRGLVGLSQELRPLERTVDDFAPFVPAGPLPLPQPPAASAPPASPAVPTSLSHLPHPIIQITQDVGPTGFVLATNPLGGLPLYRPGSGVVAGTGTPADPYVISGWDIGAPLGLPGAQAGIHISNTNAHVLIHGTRIALSEVDASILVQDAANVRIEGNLLVEAEVGVLLSHTQDATIDGNDLEGRFHGVLVIGGERVGVHANTLTRGDYGGVVVIDSTDVQIAANAFEVSFLGVYLQRSDAEIHANRFSDVRDVAVYASTGDHLFITENEVNGSDAGIVVFDYGSLHLHHNRVNATWSTLDLWSISHVTLSGNRLATSGTGSVTAAFLGGLDARDNTIIGGQTAFLVLFTPNATVEENRIRGVDEALVLAWSPDATVRGNDLVGTIVAFIAPGVRIDANTVNASWYGGIATLGSPDGRITANTIIAMGFSQYEGILVASGDESLVADNHVSGAFETAAALVFSSGSTLIGNTLEGLLVGLYIVSGEAVAVHANTFLTPYPFVLFSTDSASVIGNTIGTPGGTGSGVYFSAGSSIVGNTFQSAPGSGPAAQDVLYLMQSGGGHIEGNTFGAGGIAIEGNARADFLFEWADNTVGSRAIAYVRDEAAAVLPNDPAQVILVGAHGTTVESLTFEDVVVGVLVAHTDDASVAGNMFRGAETGIHTVASDRTGITGNDFADVRLGILLADASTAIVDDNTMTAVELGIGALFPHDLAITRNTLDGAFIGILLMLGTGSTIEANDVTDTFVSVYLYGTLQPVVRENRLTGSQHAAIYIEGGRGALTEHNDLTDGGTGVLLVDTRSTTHNKNMVTGNLQGIVVDGSSDGGEHIVNENDLVGNTLGMDAGSGLDVDARENWWGCIDGPGAPQCDTVAGNALYAPWRTAPVAGAGAP